jgi:hypothetical protein
LQTAAQLIVASQNKGQNKKWPSLKLLLNRLTTK